MQTLNVSEYYFLVEGNSKNPGSIVMKAYSGVDVNLLSLDARKLYEDDLGSCASLNTISDLTR